MIVLNPCQFGQLVRELRKKKGWTQVELARRAKLRQASISALEKGKGGTLVTLFRLLNVLSAEMDLKEAGGRKAFDVEAYFAADALKKAK